MLAEFRVSNFRSFLDERVFSMVASNDKVHTKSNTNQVGKLNLLKAAAIFGANASGKSNTIRAIFELRNFVLTSATAMNHGDPINVEPFLLDPDAPQLPTDIEVTMFIDAVRYTYAVSLTRSRVLKERLSAYPKGREQCWFERTYNPKTKSEEWSFRKEFNTAKVNKELIETTRENGLALSRGAQLAIKSLEPVYSWFTNSLRCLNLTQDPTIDEHSVLMSFTMKLWKQKPEFQEFATNLLRDADFGIDGIEIRETKFTPDLISPKAPPLIRENLLKRYSGKVMMDMSMLHTNNDGSVSVKIPIAEEASGTQRLSCLSGRLWDTLQNGYTLLIDELDCSMHPLLVRKLVEMFQNTELNSKGAQLIFTTHDTTLMDSTLLRRDQIWFCEKDQRGATDLFSLYDFKSNENGRPRNDTAFQKSYLGGRYGAIAQFGPSLDDLE